MMKRFIAIILFSVLALPTGKLIAAGFPDFTQLVEDVQPSIVSIKVDVKRWGRVAGRSGGSGFIIDNDGLILTNHHVINNGDRVLVKLHTGREYEAEVLGSDADTDVALLKINPKGLNLKSLKLGSTDKLKVGEWVLAFGAPFNLEQTVTAGIVSAKGRGEVGSQYVPFVQTDVAINRGNSGGPLVNLKGEVVGINSMIFNPMLSTGLSFSIPIDLADNVREQLLKDGRVNRGFLGVFFGNIDQDKADALGLADVGGALITGVAEGQPADKAGLKPGDVVVAIDGKSVRQAQDLPYYVGQMAPGDKVNLKVFRDGNEKTIKVTLGSNGNSVASVRAGESELGLSVTGLSEDLREAYGISRGVLVSEVADGSPAQRAGIRQGDVIQKLHRTSIRNLNDYRSALGDLPEKGKVAVLIARPGQGSDFVVMDIR
ncbi:MAG: Do family serine endopeptidase [Kangiellaceae bacterium]|nr:Do family serine endopeptidase [Kangiellaceae bacterium]